MKKVILIMLSLIIAAGCKSGSVSTEVFIRDTAYKVKPPVIIDSGRAVPEYIIPIDSAQAIDTIYRYVKVSVIGDTITDVSFNTRTAVIKYKVQPDTIMISVRDTLIKTIEQPPALIETPLLAKFGIGSVGFIIGMIFIFCLMYFSRRIE